MNGGGFKPPPLFFSNQHPWISIPPKNHPTALSSEYSTLILDANAHTSQSNNLPAHVGKIHQAKTDRPLPYAQVPKPPCKPVPYDLQTTIYVTKGNISSWCVTDDFAAGDQSSTFQRQSPYARTSPMVGAPIVPMGRHAMRLMSDNSAVLSVFSQ